MAVGGEQQHAALASLGGCWLDLLRSDLWSCIGLHRFRASGKGGQPLSRAPPRRWEEPRRTASWFAAPHHRSERDPPLSGLRTFQRRIGGSFRLHKRNRPALYRWLSRRSRGCQVFSCDVSTSSYSVHRWYEAGTGRYTRVDPLGLDLGFRAFSTRGSRARRHEFGYTRQNPTLFLDPLGLVEWTCSGIQLQAVIASGAAVQCDTGCVNGFRATTTLLVGGLGFGPDISVEATQWVLEDGTDTPDPKNLGGPAFVGGCSVTPVIGVSVGPVNAGKGNSGTFSLSPTAGLGIGCSSFTGRSRAFSSRVDCCSDTPTMRPPH